MSFTAMARKHASLARLSFSHVGTLTPPAMWLRWRCVLPASLVYIGRIKGCKASAGEPNQDNRRSSLKGTLKIHGSVMWLWSGWAFAVWASSSWSREPIWRPQAVYAPYYCYLGCWWVCFVYCIKVSLFETTCSVTLLVISPWLVSGFILYISICTQPFCFQMEVPKVAYVCIDYEQQ